MVAQFILKPLMYYDYTHLLPFTPANTLADIPKDSRLLLEVEPVSFLFFNIPQIILVCLLVNVYVQRPMTALELVSMIARKWKGIAISCFCAQVMTYATGCLLTTVDIYVQHIKVVSWASMFTSLVANLELFAAAVALLYLGFICELGLVIAVIKEDLYGIAALREARNLIRGRKAQTMVALMLFLLMDEVSNMMLGIEKRKEWKQITVSKIVAQVFVVVPAQALFQLFECSVISVFYFGCRNSHGRHNGA